MNFLMIIIFLFIQLPSKSNAEGDLSIRSKKLVLNLGSEKSDYDMSQKIFNMETGKAYRLEITSMGFKEYELEAEDFFRNIWIRSIEIDGIELDAPVINCTGKDVPMPYAANLEKLALTTTAEVISAVKKVIYE